MDNWVLLRQAVEESHYSLDHIRHLAAQGTVKAQKFGGVWLIDLEELKRYEQAMLEAGPKKFSPTKDADSKGPEA